MIFTCKNCEGNMIYSPERRTMFCPFCESQNSQEMRHVAHGQLTRFCPNCGGEIPMEEHDSAMQCPYCDNYIIQDARIENEFAPDYVIPFYLGKENCKELIRQHFKKARFAPTDFLSEVKLNTMKGWYVPFWFFDYHTRCLFRGEGRKVRSWTSGNMRYTETSYFDVVRDLSIPYSKLPADASVKMPDEIMDLMEPYDYSQMENFHPECMSGFYGEKYNMTSDLIEGRAKEKMEASAKAILRSTYTEYAGISTQQEAINITDAKTSYGLLPVWKYTYLYKGMEYPFYVNGQTGKIVGTAPISKKKVWAYSLTLGAVITALGVLTNVCAALL